MNGTSQAIASITHAATRRSLDDLTFVNGATMTYRNTTAGIANCDPQNHRRAAVIRMALIQSIAEAEAAP